MPLRRPRAQIDLIAELNGLRLTNSEVIQILQIADDHDASEKTERLYRGYHNDALGLTKAFIPAAVGVLVGVVSLVGAFHGSLSNGLVLTAIASLIALSGCFAAAAMYFYRKADKFSRRSFYVVKALQRYWGAS